MCLVDWGEFNLLFVIHENLGLIEAFGPQKFDPYSSKYWTWPNLSSTASMLWCKYVSVSHIYLIIFSLSLSWYVVCSYVWDLMKEFRFSRFGLVTWNGKENWLKSLMLIGNVNFDIWVREVKRGLVWNMYVSITDKNLTSPIPQEGWMYMKVIVVFNANKSIWQVLNLSPQRYHIVSVEFNVIVKSFELCA